MPPLFLLVILAVPCVNSDGEYVVRYQRNARILPLKVPVLVRPRVGLLTVNLSLERSMPSSRWELSKDAFVATLCEVKSS